MEMKMSEKHTPGPWHVWGEADLREHNIEDLVIVASQVAVEEQTDENSLYVCNVGSPVAPISGHTGGVGLANARLIAAAPELLEACEGWMNFLEELARDEDPDDPLPKARNAFHRERIEKTRAAIAKATGVEATKPSPQFVPVDERLTME
jgi:hypothetical protein